MQCIDVTSKIIFIREGNATFIAMNYVILCGGRIFCHMTDTHVSFVICFSFENYVALNTSWSTWGQLTDNSWMVYFCVFSHILDRIWELYTTIFTSVQFDFQNMFSWS